MNKILKFSRVGCNPCVRMSNHLHDTDVEFVELDVEEDAQMAAKFGVGSVPTLLLIDEDDNILERVVGFNDVEVDELVSKL